MAEAVYILSNDDKWRINYDEATTVISETHSFGNEVVSQTLEDGSILSDHIIIQPDELEVQLFVSNSKENKSQDIFSTLLQMRDSRVLCGVWTDHAIYEDMAIESVSAPHEAPAKNCINFTIKFKKVNIVRGRKNAYMTFQKDQRISVDTGINSAINGENTRFLDGVPVGDGTSAGAIPFIDTGQSNVVRSIEATQLPGVASRALPELLNR